MLYHRDRGLCAYCGRKTILADEEELQDSASAGLMATADHVKPLAQGGKDKMSNLILACRDCNGEKGSWFFPPHEEGRWVVDLTKDPNWPGNGEAQ